MFKRAKQWSLALVGVLILAVGMSGAYAQVQTADEMASFETYLRAGTDAQKNGEYRKAIEQFEKAAEIVDHPRLQMEIGQAYEQLGECKNARLTYEALRGRSGLEEQYIERTSERLSELEGCVEYGELVVECSDSDVELELKPVAGETERGDGNQTLSGVCPGDWRLPEGEYMLIARVAGYENFQKQVNIVAGRKAQEYVRFHESEIIELPETGGGASDWGVYAGAGAAGIGAALTTIALISDSNSGERLQELQKIEQSGNTKLFKERSDENDSIRTRNIGLYAGGAALILGGGGVLVWSLLSSDSGDANSNVSADGLTLQKRELSTKLVLQPREIGVRFQW